MKLFFSVFESKAASVICLLVAIVNRVINIVFVSYAGRDKMILLLQSKSLLNGHGLGRPFYSFENLETPVYDFTPMWPPGYPLLLSPFLKLFDYRIYPATTIVDIIFCVLFIFIIRKICRQIEMPQAGVNLITLLAGCFEYTFISESQPTDTIALVLLLTGISFTLKFISRPFSSKLLFLSSLFLFLPCVFRYNYPPVTMIIPVLILSMGFIRKDLLLKRKGWRLLIITTLFVAGFFILMKSTTGMMSYVYETQRGFFPENVLHWFPFIPASFINIAFLTSQLIQRIHIPFQSTMFWLEVVNILSVIILLVIIINLITKKKLLTVLIPFNWFLILGLGISAVVVSILGYMSLTNQIQQGFYSSWNYITEARYYAFINVFIQIVFIAWILRFKVNRSKMVFRLAAFLISFVLFFEISHNIYFHTKVAFDFQKYKSNVYREQDYAYFNKLVPDAVSKYPDYDVLVAAPGDNYFYHMASYFGYKGIADANPLKSGQPFVKRKSILIAVLSNNVLKDYERCLAGNNVQLLQTIQVNNFYLVELVPEK